jgi:hypothetical protein
MGTKHYVNVTLHTRSGFNFIFQSYLLSFQTEMKQKQRFDILQEESSDTKGVIRIPNSNMNR